jgi:hypothetical protein
MRPGGAVLQFERSRRLSLLTGSVPAEIYRLLASTDVDRCRRKAGCGLLFSVCLHI